LEECRSIVATPTTAIQGLNLEYEDASSIAGGFSTQDENTID
jgi:hypothetical protein